jgi:formamidopyrimidine-DNA glycosylase
MPELPEVQTIVNDLQILTGDTITCFWTDFQKAIKSENFEEQVIGKKIITIERLSKNVIIRIEGDKFIVIHLKMTGKLLIAKRETQNVKRKESKHLHHIFYLKKNGSLNFFDIRKFATLEVLDAETLTEITKNKGADPFSKDFTLQNFTKIIAGKKNKSVKSILMNQSAISGIGNIYASEIPYDANINPLRKGDGLNEKEIKSLFKSILRILTKAIKMRGTSISDYRDANGKKGGFQNELKVYGKAGKKCTKCDTIIEKATVEQRSTFYCPTCQK